MSSIVIIGGGLSGLAAAVQLEQLGIDYTLVEVKPRLGGTILTEKRDDFIFDGGSFIVEQYAPWDFLETYNLTPDDVVTVGPYRDGRLVMFKQGTQTLIDAMEAQLQGAILKRMAVSSIGFMNGRDERDGFGICLENGVMLNAKGVIVAIPARYAEHLLHSLDPLASQYLLDYQYDPTARVMLGYRQQDVPHLRPLIEPQWQPQAGDRPVKFTQVYADADRVPEGSLVLRVGIRVVDGYDEQALIAQAQRIAGGQEPVTRWAFFWPEADPITRYVPEHAEHMTALMERLPRAVALIGTCYQAKRLDEQIHQGQAAAVRIAQALF